MIGQGVSQDYKQAVYWYKKSAVQEDVLAQYNLGRMYAISKTAFDCPGDRKNLRYFIFSMLK